MLSRDTALSGSLAWPEQAQARLQALTSAFQAVDLLMSAFDIDVFSPNPWRPRR